MNEKSTRTRERTNGSTVMEKLGYNRFIRNIRIGQIAEKIGIDRACLSNYERGKHNVPFFVVEAMCQVLGFRLIIVDKKGKKLYESRIIEANRESY